jgi:CubicO group peptidase (beta-lactamase class C family)
MIAARRLAPVLVAVAGLAASALLLAAVRSSPATDLAGLWEAKRLFGPDTRGPLTIAHTADAWRAEIAGRSAPVKVAGDAVAFDLPDGKGAFKGKFAAGGAKIVGHWVQPRQVTNNTAYASPVVLAAAGREVWRGDVVPLDDELRLYLMVKPKEDVSVGAFLRNPESNFGRFFDIDHVERDGSTLRIIGGRPGGSKGRVLAEGTVRGDTLSIPFPSFGGTFDFRRVRNDAASDFYPRGRPGVAYSYSPPIPGDDGWPVASLEDVGISREGIRKFMQMIVDTPIDSVHAQEVHGALIARHGKLVLEEYFHGEHRNKPHDTRSAAKSLTATLVGATINSGPQLDASTPVYCAMHGGTFPAGLEDRKRALTVEHLLTMSSGLDCDDKNPSSRGNEDVMQEQTAQPDWYRYTLDLRTVREPGEQAVYGSANANLLGGVLARVSGQPLPELFHNLLARPLGITRYHMNLSPTGDAYMGGGIRFLPRDFMKLGQLYLNGGKWNGKQLLNPEWCRRAASPLYELAGIRYGYLWWVTDFPHKDRTVRAFFAGGNGGQVVMGIPELDLVVAFYGGNYSDPALYVPQRQYVPKYILPAVD